MTERGSTQHSQRLDDELSRETEALQRGAPIESHVEEWRRQEPPGEGEPQLRPRIAGDDVELRSVLAISLRPSAFPCDRDVLVAVALEEHAEEFVVEWLRTLPGDVRFPNVEAVWESLGGHTEHRGYEPPVHREPEPVERAAPRPLQAPKTRQPVEHESRSVTSLALAVPSAIAHDSVRLAKSLWHWAARRVPGVH